MIFDLNKPKGKILPLPETLSIKDSPDTYVASPELSAAVWVAITLGQPLLLTGEPGSGKTQLAYYVAKRFGIEDIHVFSAQTSSAKKDLFYTYDALGHFQWSQIEKKNAMNAQSVEQKFIRYEALGKAIQMAQQENKRSVVLIDEIDKSPRDLPNDLLGAIEDLSFTVPEIPGTDIKAWKCPDNLKPIIIITSNSEKNLPDAFLRRVIYHHITFPDAGKLLEILTAKQLTDLTGDDLEIVIDHFLTIRKEEYTLSKTPATAELIQWAMLLPKIGFPVQKLRSGKLSAAEQKMLHASYAILAKSREDLEKLIAMSTVTL